MLGVAALARGAQFIEAFLAVLVADAAGGGALLLGLVLLAQQAGATAGAAFAGSAVDRYGARRVARAGLIAAGAAALALGVVTSPVALVVSAGAYGLASSGWRLALQAAVAVALTQDAASGTTAADLRARAYGALVWVSNAGALLSGGLAAGGLPIRAAFLAQAVMMALAAVATSVLPASRTGGAGPPVRPGIDPRLWLVAAAFVPATLVMFQAFSGLALALDEDDYRTMVLVNAAVLVLAQPLVRVLIRRAPAGPLLAGAALVLGLGIAATALLGGSVIATVAWSVAELVLITLAPAVVAGAAPQAALGRHQAVFQVSQGLVAAAATLAGPLLFAGSETAFFAACAGGGLLGALALLRASATLGGALAHPVACPCGSLRCACDAAHALCSSPSPALVHAAVPRHPPPRRPIR